MQDRRASVRDKVIFGGVAEFNDTATMDCVVRNFSEHGACVEVEPSAKIPQQMNLTIARKGRSRCTAAPKRTQETAASAPHQGTAWRRLIAAWKARVGREAAEVAGNDMLA